MLQQDMHFRRFNPIISSCCQSIKLASPKNTIPISSENPTYSFTKKYDPYQQREPYFSSNRTFYECVQNDIQRNFSSSHNFANIKKLKAFSKRNITTSNHNYYIMKFSALSIALAATAVCLPSATAFGLTRSAVIRASPLFVSSIDDMITDTEAAITPPMIVTDDADSKSAMAMIPSFVRGAETSDAPDILPQGVRLTGADKLHKEGLTGKGIKVAVIDDGISAAHPGFEGKVVQQTWFHSDPIGHHGTHVAGTIHMMAPDAEIYDYRAMDGSGRGGFDVISEAIREAIADGVDVINMSLGSPSSNFRLFRAVRDAHRAGIIVVCAAGNNGDGNPLTNERFYPAYYRQAINVAAVAKEDNLPTASFSNSNSQVDYAGIGVDVVSFKPGGTYQALRGTSMASPHVCGFIAALMTKGGAYEDIIKNDATLRALVNDKFSIDIGSREGVDRDTGLGFLTYLTEEEFEKGFYDLP